MKLLALVLLASPQFAEVRPCDPLEPLRWETWLYRDGGEGLFEQEAFLPETEWVANADDVTGGRLVADCFDDPTPHSRELVVHHYPPAPLTPPHARPVVLVTGAGDNALRSLSFLAVTLSRAGFHVYAPTFAHRHGDNYAQAEHVANLVALAAERHGATKVDVVAYSKGGLAARIYASNTADAEWPHAAYDAAGTRFRDDVGRLVLLGSANAGLDTLFRWPSSNLFSVGDAPIDAPTSWIRYWGGGFPVDLSAREVSAAHFPGQAQMLADLTGMHPLPGGNPAFGAYANQPDYLTTYLGGVGFVSESRGISNAIDAGLGTIEAVQRNGVAPSVELHLAAGGNPILSVGGLDAGLYQAWWGDEDAAGRRRTWESLLASALEATFPWWAEAFEHDLPRLFAGTAFLGEVSGPSDGLVFVASALDDSGLTAAGAEVASSHLFHALNHSELVAAGTLAADFYGDDELAGPLHDPALAEKYGRAENQAVEWVRGLLEAPVPERPPMRDGGVAPADAGPATDAADPDAGTDAEVLADGRGLTPAPDAKPTADPPDAGGPDAADSVRAGERFGGSCATTRSTTGGGWWLLVLGCARRRSRTAP